MDKSSGTAAKEKGRTAARIRALEERYRHELMDEDERLELRERIARLKKTA